jgi:hypothetical protein
VNTKLHGSSGIFVGEPHDEYGFLFSVRGGTEKRNPYWLDIGLGFGPEQPRKCPKNLV